MANHTSSRVAKQPFKAFFIAYFMTEKLVKLPFLLLLYSVPALRPHRGYTYQTAFMVKLTQWIFDFLCKTEFKWSLTLEPGKEGDRFVVIDPQVKPDTDAPYRHLPMKPHQPSPPKIGAVWYPTPVTGPTSIPSDQKVILHIHGGAYLLYGGREYPFGPGLREYSKAFNAPVLAPEYRLAWAEDVHFADQIQDVVTSYRYLLHDLKIDPARIVLSGDSGGGHLALALLKYISSVPNAGLPLPSAALLWSPWVDMADCRTGPNPKADTIIESMIDWASRVVPGEYPLEHEYLSLNRSDFVVPIPIWVSAGQQERHYDRIAPFVERMRSAGANMTLHTTVNYPHDVWGSWNLMGGRQQFYDAMADAAKFIGVDVKSADSH